MRIFFIPGFGEDPSIFDKIHPHIPGEKVFIDNWELVEDRARPDLTAWQYASELVNRYEIRPEDVVIGHSMGGWIAYHIKQLVHCPIIQIASWTKERKVVKPIKNQRLIYWAVKRNIYFNPLIKKLIIWKSYRQSPSAEVFSSVFDRLRKANKEQVINQLRITLNPESEPETEQPDLRIHARGDSIVRFPDEPCYEVPGDHFTLWTHPEKVVEPINSFLQLHKKGAAAS